MAEASVPSLEWLRKRLEEADPDLLRAMVETVVATLMSAEADALCGALMVRASRNGPTAATAIGSAAGTPASARFRCRSPNSFPDWLLEPRRRAEKTIVQVVAKAYLRGVSVRRI